MELTKETLELFFNSIGLTNNLIYVLITILVLNIIATGLKFYFELKLQDRENVIHKKKLLIENAIKIQETIYSRLEKISLYTRDEEKLMLTDIQELQRYVTNNRIYLSKGMLKIIDLILDYYRGVLTDYRRKDYRKEIDFFETYAKEFSK